MKTILPMILLGLLLSCASCNPGPDAFIGEQCSPQFKIIKDADGKEWVDVSSSVCRCRQYEISINRIGPVNERVTRHHLSHCNLLKGYSPDVDTKLVNFLNHVREEIQKPQGGSNEQ